MKYPFSYKVVCHDYEQNETYQHAGIGLSDSYQQAAAIIETYYGGELIEIQHLELFEQNELIILPEATYEKVVEALNE